MIEIDGSQGEGGGQIIRTSLTLSLATGKPFRVYNVRAARPRPGLLAQHLAAVMAAAEVGCAQTQGAELRSRDLTFVPGQGRAGNYRFAIGSAGSTTLVLQTILPVLLTAPGPSHLTLEGGTHNSFAPPFEFLERSFLPIINRLGPVVRAKLIRPGFYPVGGGTIEVTVEPCRRLSRLELLQRGKTIEICARAIVSRLPLSIAERELHIVQEALSLQAGQLEVIEETRSPGPGNVVLIEIHCEQVTEVVTAFGQRGLPAELVAQRAANEAAAYLASSAPVGVHLADQLFVPMAIGDGGQFLTMRPSAHTRTNIEVLRRFLDNAMQIAPAGDGTYRIDVGGRSPPGDALRDYPCGCPMGTR